MSDDLREDVDAFLSARKDITTFSDWRADQRTGEYLLVTSLLVDGEIIGRLELQAYPNEPQPAYRIVLLFLEKCVARFDCREADGPHYNSPDRPSSLGAGPIFGQHVHLWSDNRHFARYNSLPDKLHNARELQPLIRSFESALRWFCGEFNIDISGAVLPALPPKDKLL